MPVSVVGVNISKTGNYTILITVSGRGLSSGAVRLPTVCDGALVPLFSPLSGRGRTPRLFPLLS
ncbi:hypothetical protein FEM41_09740 [Jejubacter calystegiae]|uniref:Uncharacterized protein n=1 Tax=Jejubacter calystegiae TaxID=2579935 RepID=A0A4P8YH62_9ENTR|nr:hypothetical protein FEM41_09740 [Jejubacter calystegiae]